MPFYAVRECSPYGSAIFTKWPDCDKFVKGRKADGFRKFDTIELALEFIKVNLAVPFKNERIAPKSTVSVKKAPVFKEAAADEWDTWDDDDSERTNVSAQYGRLTTFEHNGKLRNQKGALVIYTDGACPGNGKRRNGVAVAKSGCGVFGGEWLQESFVNPSGHLPQGKTNNFAEAHAIERALQCVCQSDETRVEIRTDSMYCIDSITKWSSGWIKRAQGGVWHNSSNKPIVHQAVFEQILKMMKTIKVDYTHVRGHSGIDRGNDMADQLAVKGAQS